LNVTNEEMTVRQAIKQTTGGLLTRFKEAEKIGQTSSPTGPGFEYSKGYEDNLGRRGDMSSS
jgi:hypothetical protein